MTKPDKLLKPSAFKAMCDEAAGLSSKRGTPRRLSRHVATAFTPRRIGLHATPRLSSLPEAEQIKKH